MRRIGRGEGRRRRRPVSDSEERVLQELRQRRQELDTREAALSTRGIGARCGANRS